MGKIILIDSGHGGMLNGKYLTAPNKMHIFNAKNIAYEGVINRQIKSRLIDRLQKESLPYIDVCPTQLDIPLETRVETINAYCDAYGAENVLLISLHSNTGGGTGIEIWTSKGATQSDIYATMLGNIIKKDFPNESFRADYTEGDLDKESLFYILVHTKCPAILPEFMFFDNWEDYKKLRKPGFQEKYVDSLTKFIKQC